MKKSIFILFLVFTVVFNSCKKDDPAPDRDKFIGKYHGTVVLEFYFNNNLSSTTTSAITETIDPASASDEILIGANTVNEMKGRVSGYNVSIYNQAVFIDNGEGIMVQATASGSGVFSNNTVTLNYEFTGIYQGYPYRYKYTEIIAKD